MKGKSEIRNPKSEIKPLRFDSSQLFRDRRHPAGPGAGPGGGGAVVPRGRVVERKTRRARLLGSRALRRRSLPGLPRPHDRRLVRRRDVRLMEFGLRISEFGILTHRSRTRDACPIRLRAGRSAVTSNRDLLATAKSRGRSRVGQPSRLPGGRVGNPKSEIRNPNRMGRVGEVRRAALRFRFFLPRGGVATRRPGGAGGGTRSARGGAGGPQHPLRRTAVLEGRPRRWDQAPRRRRSRSG